MCKFSKKPNLLYLLYHWRGWCIRIKMYLRMTRIVIMMMMSYFMMIFIVKIGRKFGSCFKNLVNIIILIINLGISRLNSRYRILINLLRFIRNCISWIIILVQYSWNLKIVNRLKKVIIAHIRLVILKRFRGCLLLLLMRIQE